jgi:hypothetical protein
VLVVGRGIENSVQASLQLGMQFSELSQLPQLCSARSRAIRLVRWHRRLRFQRPGDLQHRSRAASGRKYPATWKPGRRALQDHRTWATESPEEYVAGISLKNAFDLTVGFLALRYSRDEVERAAATAGREILMAALGSFLGIAIVAPLALIVVIRRFERDLRTLEAAASHLEDRSQPAPDDRQRIRHGDRAPACLAARRQQVPRRPEGQARLGRLAGAPPCSRKITSGESTGASPA